MISTLNCQEASSLPTRSRVAPRPPVHAAKADTTEPDFVLTSLVGLTQDYDRMDLCQSNCLEGKCSAQGRRFICVRRCSDDRHCLKNEICVCDGSNCSGKISHVAFNACVDRLKWSDRED